jgi:hypothetical protein
LTIANNGSDLSEYDYDPHALVAVSSPHIVSCRFRSR